MITDTKQSRMNELEDLSIGIDTIEVLVEELCAGKTFVSDPFITKLMKVKPAVITKGFTTSQSELLKKCGKAKCHTLLYVEVIGFINLSAATQGSARTKNFTPRFRAVFQDSTQVDYYIKNSLVVTENQEA